MIILSGSSDRARIGAALDGGALAWVPKNAPLPALLAAVRAAQDGRPVMAAEQRDQLIATARRLTAERGALTAKLDRLSQREREVLAMLAQGRRAQAVAEHFVVSLATVRTQIRAVLAKLEVSSQLEAVALYRKATGANVDGPRRRISGFASRIHQGYPRAARGLRGAGFCPWTPQPPPRNSASPASSASPATSGCSTPTR